MEGEKGNLTHTISDDTQNGREELDAGAFKAIIFVLEYFGMRLANL